LLSDASVFVLPSVYEPFSICTLEAMAVGLPVIASNIGGPAELIKSGKTGILVQPKNPEAISGAVISVLENRKFAASLGSNAKAFVKENFTWQKVLPKYVELYCG